MKKLSVVIPAYNEARRISNTLLSVHDFLLKQPYESEILVVNDGSSDTTADVVSRVQPQIPNLKLIDNKENHGKGWVVKQGMLEVTGDVRVFMDADNSTNIREIEKLLPFFDQGYEVVVGSRRIAGANVAKDQQKLREFLGAAFRAIVRILVPVGVIDTQCGFKAVTGKASEIIFPQQTIFRWAFDVEILALARKNHFKIKEVPITWVNDEGGHVKLSGMITMMLEIMQIRFNLWNGAYKKV